MYVKKNKKKKMKKNHLVLPNTNKSRSKIAVKQFDLFENMKKRGQNQL